MKVIDLARRAGETPEVVRYYTRIGLLNPARNPGNGYKRFVDADLVRLRFIRQAKALGFTLAEIAEILDHARGGGSPCPKVREIIERRIEENRHRLEELTRLQQRMESALERWRGLPDGVPDGHTVCHLIESEEGMGTH